MGVVYFLQRANGDIKIGTAWNYKTRLRVLKKKYGDLTLLGAITGSYELETQLHAYFSDYQIGRSEFFAPEPKLLKFIQKHSNVSIDTLNKSQSASKNLYFTDEQVAQVNELMEALEDRGVKLRDQRGVQSISALFRYLVEDKMKQLKLKGQRP